MANQATMGETNFPTQDAAGTPTIEELGARARALLPRLRERAAHTEALRRLPDETIEDFRRAGFFRIFQPARYGGYEIEYGPVQIELGSLLGRACGSSAWVQSVVACHAWILGMFSPAAQDAVWGSDPDVLVTTAISSLTGKARRVQGGYFVEGQWQFSSGIDAAGWIQFMALLEGEGGPPQARWCLLPRSEWEIVDTWFAAGLRGTGSKDVRVNGAFVPEDFTLDPALMDGRHSLPGSAVNASYIYRLPLWPIFPYNVACPALGVAHSAVEEYIAQTAAHRERAGQDARQLRIAESAVEVDAAEALLRADAAELTRLGRAGTPISLEQQVRWPRNLSFAAVLCMRAVDRLAAAVGAHGMLEANPVQRALRDVHAIANHGGLAWDVRGLSFGRVVLGLDPY